MQSRDNAQLRVNRSVRLSPGASEIPRCLRKSAPQTGDTNPRPVLHRDVSVYNIMYEVRDSEPFFILTDYDLFALEKPDDEDAWPSSKYRTWTLPFMPCEVLEDLWLLECGGGPLTPHLLRYDFESLYWVSLWCTMTMEPVKDTKLKQAIKTSLSDWETGSFYTIAARKKNVINTRKAFDELPMTPLYQHCRGWLSKWNDVLYATYSRLRDYDKDMSDGERDRHKREFVRAELEVFERNTAGWWFWTIKNGTGWNAGWSARDATTAEILPKWVGSGRFKGPPPQEVRYGALKRCHGELGEVCNGYESGKR